MVSGLSIASSLPLAPTLGPLVREGGATPREALDRLAADGFRHVQLDAMTPGLRPRELDASARRDVLAVLRRLELTICGIDLWIPSDHWLDSSKLDRAVGAALATIALAADLQRQPVCLLLPATDDSDSPLSEALDAIAREAERRGVLIADHSVPPSAHEQIGVGIDPVAWLANGKDPAKGVLAHAARLGSARVSEFLSTGQRAPLQSAPGGSLDLAGYQLALAGAGYHHPVVLDARQWPDAWRGLAQSVNAWSTPSAAKF